METVNIIIGVVILGTVIAAFFNRGKTWADLTISGFAHMAEEVLGSKEGQAKLESVIANVNEMAKELPFYARILIKPFITKIYIEKVIRKMLNHLNGNYKTASLINKSTSIAVGEMNIEKLTMKLKDRELFGDYNKVSNEQIDEEKEKLLRGYAKAKAEIITDLKETSARVGAEIGVKF